MPENATLKVASGNGDLRETLLVGEGRNIPEHPSQPLLEQKIYKVLVGVPLKGGTPARSYHDRMLMLKYLGNQEATDFFEKKNPRYVFNFGSINDIPVHFARERLAEGALGEECDYLFMIDDDMLAPPDLFYKLVAHDKDICAALAFTRNPDHMPVIYQTIEGFSHETGQSYGFTRFVNNYPRNTLVECDAVGFGAVLIKMDVFRKLQRPWFVGMEGTGEDITFCIKARKAGFNVFMDTSLKLGHLGTPCIITEDYSDQWNKMTSDEKEKLYGRFTKYETDTLT